MNTGGIFEVFRKEFGKNCDYFQLHVSVPTIIICHESSDWAGSASRTYAASAHSEVKLMKSDVHWYFGFCILGFGVYATRQWDY